MTKKQTHPQLPLDKAIRASVHYHIEADGTISQVINHILPTGEKKGRSPTHRLTATKRTFSATNRADALLIAALRIACGY